MEKEPEISSQRRTNCLAKLAGNTSLFPVRIAAQCVLTAKARAQGALLIGVVQGHLGLEEITQRERHARQQLAQKQTANAAIDCCSIW